MPVSNATLRIGLILGRVVWALFWVPCAFTLGKLALDTQPKNNDSADQYFSLYPALSSLIISFISPFLVPLRGQMAPKAAAVSAISLALGAWLLFSVKVYALSPDHEGESSATVYALRNLPLYLAPFAIGAAICGILTVLGRLVFKPTP